MLQVQKPGVVVQLKQMSYCDNRSIKWNDKLISI